MAALTTPVANSVIPSSAASIEIGIAGGTITIGHPVYYDSTTATYKEANADSTGSAAIAAAVGIALNSCVATQRVMVCKSDPLFGHGFTASETTPGAFVYLNDTAGTYTVTVADLDQTDYFVFVGQINNPETTMRLVFATPVLGT